MPNRACSVAVDNGAGQFRFRYQGSIHEGLSLHLIKIAAVFRGKDLQANLVARDKAEEFSRSLAKGYQAETGYPPEIYITHASNGAELLK